MEININNKILEKETKTSHSNTPNKDEEYLYYDYIDISIGDPISAILLTNNYVIIGTMTGGIKLYSFNEKRIYIISKNNTEFISGFSFSSHEKSLYASIGDYQYLKYEMKEPFIDNSMPYTTNDLYETTTRHNYSCNDAYVLMSHDNILKLTVCNPELQESINEEYINYDITYLKKSLNTNSKSKIEGKILSTNYYIPLEFDGSNFCWVEFKDDIQNRDICVEDISKATNHDTIDNRLSVDKNYGHISHAKLLKGNKILIIHNLNKCDIYEINEHFDKLDEFEHIGDEVYSVDIAYGYNTLSRSYNKENIISNKNNIIINFDECGTNDKFKANESQKLKVRQKRLKSSNSVENMDSLNMIKYNIRKEKYTDKYIIITLDIDGNVNKYENKEEGKLFNLYEIKGIYQDFKDKKFFSMGYMYYIKTNLAFFCITTDHGCFIIKKNDD